MNTGPKSRGPLRRPGSRELVVSKCWFFASQLVMVRTQSTKKTMRAPNYVFHKLLTSIFLTCMCAPRWASHIRSKLQKIIDIPTILTSFFSTIIPFTFIFILIGANNRPGCSKLADLRPGDTFPCILENRAVNGKKMPLEESRGVTINQLAVVIPLIYEFLGKSTSHLRPRNFPDS